MQALYLIGLAVLEEERLQARGETFVFLDKAGEGISIFCTSTSHTHQMIRSMCEQGFPRGGEIRRQHLHNITALISKNLN